MNTVSARCRHRRAGEDADRLAGGERARGGTARGHPLDHGQPRLARGSEIGVAHRVAVDRRIVERRQIDGRHHVAREHAAARRRLSATRLDLGDRRDALADDALDLVDRQQRAREREAVVGELRHHAGPACAGSGVERRGVPHQKIGDALDVVEIDHGNAGRRQRLVGGNRDDRRVVGMEQRLADRGPVHFELGMALALVAFDQHQIDRAELLEQRAERGLGLAAQLVDQRPAAGGADQHLGRAGHAVAVRILARLVDIEGVMGVLDRRHREPARDQAGDHLDEERGLAGAAPAGEADDAHGAL